MRTDNLWKFFQLGHEYIMLIALYLCLRRISISWPKSYQGSHISSYEQQWQCLSQQSGKLVPSCTGTSTVRIIIGRSFTKEKKKNVVIFAIWGSAPAGNSIVHSFHYGQFERVCAM